MSNLSQQIREGTKKSHTMAENTGFITCFLKGVVEKKSYVRLLSDLYHIYSAMEEEFERHKDDMIVSNIYFPELFRKKSLEKDLEYYLGYDWKERITQTQSCKEYVARIKEVSNENQDLLIAHHYTRYIGDLSGGQVLKNIAQSALEVPDVGMNFYIFKDIEDEKVFKQDYRDVLDELPFDQNEINEIIKEANLAFKLNMNVFNEIEGNLISAIGKVLFSTLTRRQRRGSTE
jgi:heme oxygenase